LACCLRPEDFALADASTRCVCDWIASRVFFSGVSTQDFRLTTAADRLAVYFRNFGGEVYVGYADNRGDLSDAYGHRPGQKGFNDRKLHDREWETFHVFKGEYARLFYLNRSGVTFWVGRI